MKDEDIGKLVLLACGLGLLGVLIWIVVNSLKPKGLVDGPICDTLSALPNQMVCHEQWISTGYKIDLNANGHNYGYFFKTIDTTSLTNVTFQLVPSVNENVSWVDAVTDNWSFTTTYKFHTCKPSGGADKTPAYELYEKLEDTVTSALTGAMYSQFNIKKNGVDIATSMRTNVFVDEVHITSLDGSTVYATLSKDLLSSFVIGTYNVSNHSPEVLDNWFVAFLAALIMIRTRQQKEARDRTQA
jgi:hypothetical protein